MTETVPIVYECRSCHERFIGDFERAWGYEGHVIERSGHAWECRGDNCSEVCPVPVLDICGPVITLGHGGRLKRPYDLRPYRKLFLEEVRG